MGTQLKSRGVIVPIGTTVLLLAVIQLSGIDARRDASSRIHPIELARRISDGGGGSGIACTPNQTFTCDNQKCIPKSWVCDGDLDCLGGEDEKDCHAGCNDKEFTCASSQTSDMAGPRGLVGCIPKDWRCDGEFDCDDHSDEQDCEKITCNNNQFKCSEFDGKFQLCIPATWKCDGQRDCASGDDEKDCGDKKCAEGDFKCSNGVCIFKNWECDGEDDCGDGSDERNCTDKDKGHTCDKEHMFKCERSAGCISKEWVCDGESDCSDHSDERNCSTVIHECKLPTEFACKTGRHCINKLWRCDGEADCPDASDEADCEEEKCGEGERICPNGKKCFPESFWCDGKEDCADGSDEEGCARNATECDSLREYTCPGTPLQCVPIEKLCSNKNNYFCDELTCTKNISLCTEGSDACKCRNGFVKNVRICHCESGYVAKNGRCEDINECTISENGGRVCDQICINQPGGYTCECHTGYKLSKRPNDTVSSRCRAIGGDPLVLLSNRATIRQFDPVTREYQPLIESPGSAVAMDFHLQNETLVWSDIALHQIMMCKIGNQTEMSDSHLTVKKKCMENEQYVVYTGAHTPDGLCIDWVHDLLFWTDAGVDEISVMNLNTGKKRVLFNTNLDEPRAIAVDPEMGLIFWTDWGKQARIERAGMDGQHRTVIVTGQNVQWPNGLALDILEKRVYWADAKTKTISSCDYWGQNVRMVLHSHTYLRHPFSLSVFEDRVYFTDWEHDGVITINKFNGADVTKVMSRIPTPMTVRIYHKQAQPEHADKCEASECGENKFCLPKAAIVSKQKNTEPHYDGHPFSCVCEGGLGDIEKTAECIIDVLAGGNSQGFSLTTMLLFLALAAMCVGGFAWYRGRVRGGTFQALNFDNPVYRRTVEQEMDDPFRDPFRDDVVIHPMGPTVVEQPPTIHHMMDHSEDRNTMVEPMDQHLTA